MGLICSKFLKALFGCRYKITLVIILLFATGSAHASMGIVDAMDLSPFVPIILDALMSVATATYNFFVGTGDGVIYIFIWGILGFTIGLSLIKMFFPKNWLTFFGFGGSDGGEAFEGKLDTKKMIISNLLKPIIRATVAAIVLLQIKPVYITDWLVNPFLEFGAIYTQGIMETISTDKLQTTTCAASISENNYINEKACDFMIGPIAQITHENNQVVKRGFEFLGMGLAGMMNMVPNGGRDFLNIITGILLISAFVSSNFFMALLIIQGIFNFGMALILYPFKVLIWVVKKSEDWVNPWPVFNDIVEGLKKLVITMIACGFILVVNIAIIKSLFDWNSTIFTTDNANQFSQSMGFGSHSVLWLSAILTFYLMFKIFEETKKQIEKYSGSEMKALHTDVSKDFKGGQKSLGKLVGTVKNIITKKK